MRCFLTIVVTIILFGVVSNVLGNDIKLVQFSNRGKECFLSDAELEKFSGVLQRIKRDDDPTRGKFESQEFIFYYWAYSKADKELKKHSISFAANGRSISWKMNEGDAHIIVLLTQELLKRVKETSKAQGE